MKWIRWCWVDGMWNSCQTARNTISPPIPNLFGSGFSVLSFFYIWEYNFYRKFISTRILVAAKRPIDRSIRLPHNEIADQKCRFSCPLAHYYYIVQLFGDSHRIQMTLPLLHRRLHFVFAFSSDLTQNWFSSFAH